jgi:hypothetical protein
MPTNTPSAQRHTIGIGKHKITRNKTENEAMSIAQNNASSTIR